jgi:diaminopimelate epimerase
MRFTKMHGAGNDFLIFDPGEVEGADLPELARRSCDRHFGVGGDGILVPAHADDDADLEMVYFNSDGSPSEMCGNGLRCLARYARDYELVERDALTIATGAGVKKVILYHDGSVGQPIENDPLFPHRTNVEFVHVRVRNEVRMRIWERGAGETLASGSGSCAAAVAALATGLAESPVTVHLDGGAVSVDWAGGAGPVYMTGPAEYICEGELL